MYMAGPEGKRRRRRSREGSSSSSRKVYHRGCVSASVMMVRPDGGRSHAERGGSSSREIHERERVREENAREEEEEEDRDGRARRGRKEQCSESTRI
jgi:hypothetical protein